MRRLPFFARVAGAVIVACGWRLLQPRCWISSGTHVAEVRASRLDGSPSCRSKWGLARSGCSAPDRSTVCSCTSPDPSPARFLYEWFIRLTGVGASVRRGARVDPRLVVARKHIDGRRFEPSRVFHFTSGLACNKVTQAGANSQVCGRRRLELVRTAAGVAVEVVFPCIGGSSTLLSPIRNCSLARRLPRAERLSFGRPHLGIRGRRRGSRRGRPRQDARRTVDHPVRHRLRVLVQPTFELCWLGLQQGRERQLLTGMKGGGLLWATTGLPVV